MLFVVGSTALAGAQTSAEIIYAEGNEFTIIGSEGPVSFDPFTDNVIGMQLEEGDVVQTAEETFLEIRVAGAENYLKVAENTVFTIESMGSGGGGSFSMTYGRLRAKVNRLLYEEDFRISGSSAVAGVRGTDFGYDIILVPEKEASGEGDGVRGEEEPLQTGQVAKVYCFDGEVEVQTFEPEDFVGDRVPDTAEPAAEGGSEETEGFFPDDGDEGKILIVRANEMITLEESMKMKTPSGDSELPKEVPSIKIRRSSINSEIQSFWDANSFQSPEISLPEQGDEDQKLGAKATESDTEDGGEAGDAAKEKHDRRIITEKEELTLRKQALIVQGNTLTILGTLTAAGGVITAVAGQDIFPGMSSAQAEQVGLGLTITGGSMVLGGIFSYVGAALE